MSAAAMRSMPAFEGVACETGVGLKFTPLHLRMRTLYRLKAKIRELVTLSCNADTTEIHVGTYNFDTYTGFQYSVSNTTAHALLLAYQLHYCDIILLLLLI